MDGDTVSNIRITVSVNSKYSPTSSEFFINATNSDIFVSSSNILLKFDCAFSDDK